ncbi:MAG TPA: DUF4232 domain-containing protein [Conexibacter sp.]|jgi:ABC-type Fe2+-enterobactin transport system substrate-binding protein
MRLILPHQPRRAARAVIAAAAAAACLAAVAVPTASAATPRCTVPNLKGSFKNASAGAGQRFVTLALKNSSSTSCSLAGYPGAQLLSASGREIATNVVRDHSKTPKTVVLRAGQSALSQWHWGAIAGRGEPVTGKCEPTPSKIEVTPPNATGHLVLAWRGGPVCEHGQITVRPMTK